ncbi:MAG: SDR family oxidoreductase [Porticoccaceae bacterium]|nr:SDR family oxidoreductase [Porticoccaceae bacterium]
MNLNGAVIAITGAGGGLGLAMARQLGADGARIALIDSNRILVERAQTVLAAAGVESRSYTADIADESAVETVFQAIGADFGQLNGLVNNAGIIRDGLLVKAENGRVTHKMPLSDWQAVMAVNLTGVFLCGREAAAMMVAGGQGGCIINISSIAAAGNMGQTNYAAAKAGVIAMTVTWSKELSRHGIRSAAIAPGFVRTPILEDMKPAALQKIAELVPLKRMAEPKEIAEAAAFIFSNDYFNGRVLEIDGGLRL